MDEDAGPGKFLFVGNNLSLDFVNTEIVADGAPKDLLENLGDVAAWAGAAQLVESGEARKLARSWRSGAKTSQAFDRIKQFRKSWRDSVERLARGENIRPGMVGKINDALRVNTGFGEIVTADDGARYEKIYRAEYVDPDQLLAPIAESAADLLCYGDPGLIKKCENPVCILYFYDATKNRQRRWCSMAACGNRAKAAAFYLRRRGEKSA